jgi:membrane protein DedA with SNARE-associated domain
VGLAAVASWVAVGGPGEAALIAAGIGAARGHVDLAGMIAVAWLGATAGGTAGWVLGRHGGRVFMTARGPLATVRLRMLEHGDRLYARWGPIAVFFGPSWMAGINAMRPSRFLPANAASALLWAVSFGLGAYLVGPKIADVLGEIGAVGIGLLALAFAAGLVVRWRRG